MIRLRLLEIFGKAIPVILDWYHLSKKLRDLMSMIACNKVEKSTHLRELFSSLARSRANCLEYLQTQVQPRNAQKQAELMGYLEKHQKLLIMNDASKQASPLAVDGWKKG